MRTTAPPNLAGLRLEGLAQVRALGRPPVRDDIPDTYRRVAGDLYQMQRYRCCYCEVFIHQSFNDVEHYRPCSLYWWLAWDWDNLLFACARCNRRHKNATFELAPGTTRLVAEDLPPGGEVPLLVNPVLDDPRDHIRYVLVNGRWLPTHRTDAGKHTIELLALDADALIEHMGGYYSTTLAPAVAELERAVHDTSAPLSVTWRQVIERITAPHAHFLGLAEDVLATRFATYPAPPRPD